jgi:hypothetical protein
MNKSTTLRSEEARRQAQAASLHAKQQQDAKLNERAMMFASETQKVEDLRAKRLARTASDEIVGPKAERIPATRPTTRQVRSSATVSAKSRAGTRSSEHDTGLSR